MALNATGRKWAQIGLDVFHAGHHSRYTPETSASIPGENRGREREREKEGRERERGKERDHCMEIGEIAALGENKVEGREAESKEGMTT